MTTTTDYYIREPIGRIMAGISRMFLSNLQKNLAELDIERSFYPLLLIEAAEGMLTQNELAEKLSSNKVQIVRIVDYLSLNGYVERVRNLDDRRKMSLQITEKARKCIPEIRKAIHASTEVALQDIPEDKVDELYALLKQIDKNLSSHNVR